jgi:hypothetical protein
LKKWGFLRKPYVAVAILVAVATILPVAVTLEVFKSW